MPTSAMVSPSKSPTTGLSPSSPIWNARSSSVSLPSPIRLSFHAPLRKMPIISCPSPAIDWSPLQP